MKLDELEIWCNIQNALTECPQLNSECTNTMVINMWYGYHKEAKLVLQSTKLRMDMRIRIK